jgi:hypothetical protein
LSDIVPLRFTLLLCVISSATFSLMSLSNLFFSGATAVPFAEHGDMAVKSGATPDLCELLTF